MMRHTSSFLSLCQMVTGPLYHLPASRGFIVVCVCYDGVPAAIQHNHPLTEREWKAINRADQFLTALGGVN